MEEKPLMMMTGSELIALAKEIYKALPKPKEPQQKQEPKGDLPEYVLGWNGLARLFGVTVNTAKRRYESGALKGACKVVDGKLVTHSALALEKWSAYQMSKQLNK
jgi:hypothetical protein